MATRAELEQGYQAAREASDRMGYDGAGYERYLRESDAEHKAKGYDPKPWPASLIGNDGD